MPMVTLSDASDAKLKLLVTDPFEDTRESLIAALIDAEVERRGVASNGNGRGNATNDHAVRLDPDSHDNLTFTRLISATVDGHPIHRPKWNSIMNHLHILGRKRLSSYDALRRASGANVREGKYEADGYKYLPEADVSIQGVAANLAWSHALRLARALRVPIEVTLEWRDDPGAARPGRRAKLQWAPTTP
jgi:hypothetical protein